MAIYINSLYVCMYICTYITRWTKINPALALQPLTIYFSTLSITYFMYNYVSVNICDNKINYKQTCRIDKYNSHKYSTNKKDRTL
jgi:hypothetical protein